MKIVVIGGTGLIGTGLLTSIPQTVVMMILAGSFSATKPVTEAVPEDVGVEYALS